jgi:hypothetical protein
MIGSQASESQTASAVNSSEPKMRRGRSKAAVLGDITNLAESSNGGNSTIEVDKVSLRSKVCLIFAVLS